MEPAVGVALCWLLFGGLHVGLATARVRSALVARLGETGFLGVFSLVAALSFVVLIRYVAAHRFEGGPGLALGNVPVFRGVLIVAVVVGFVLALGSLASYPTSPYALLGDAVRSPHGLERITRHPFFAGVVLAAGAHVCLAPRLVGATFHAGLALLAWVGMWHQDRKLLRLRGEPYARYLAATSAVPFAAVLAGRQRVVWRELPWLSLVIAALTAVWLRSVHDGIFDRGGMWLIVAVVGGAAMLGLQSWRVAHRRVGHDPLVGARHA
jgi:uncharacterized membrane protein